MNSFFKTLLMGMFFIGLFSCAGKTPYVSELADSKITIDGYSSEWSGDLQYIKNSTVAYGVKHDEENLYVCIKSTSRRFNREMMTKGFYIWFDENGKSKKHTGIKYPTGLDPQIIMNMRRTNQQAEFPLFIPTEFEFYANQTDQMLMPLMNNVKNIEIEMLSDQDIIVTEMKIPLDVVLEKFTKDEISKIGIGFELASIDREKMMSEMGGMSGGRGGLAGRSGRRGGRGGQGGMGGRSGMSRPEQTTFKKWIKVDISE